MIYIKKQILIIGNDSVFCKALQDTLQDDLTDILYMQSSIEALASFMEENYCLVILDIQLSDMNGLELLRTLRHTKHTPILAPTEPVDIDAQISLLLSGANVFLKKPINIQLCKAQANTLIQLYLSSEKNRSMHAPIIYGDEFVLIPRYRQVIIDGKFLELSRKEYDLLRFFARHPNQVFSREQLYNHVWKNSSPIAVDESVKSQIKSLRKKLASVGKHYVQNEWGVGYKFVAPNS